MIWIHYVLFILALQFNISRKWILNILYSYRVPLVSKSSASGDQPSWLRLMIIICSVWILSDLYVCNTSHTHFLRILFLFLWLAKLINITFGQNTTLFYRALERQRGILKPVRPSVCLSICVSVRLYVCLSVPPSVTKTLTLIIFSEVLKTEHC